MSINMHIIRKLVKYSLKNRFVNPKFSITVFEILLLEGRSVLSPNQRGAGSERVKFSVEAKKMFDFCWYCLKND